MTKKAATPIPEAPQSLEDVAKYQRRVALLLRQIRQEEETFKAKVEQLEVEAAKYILPKQEEAIGLSKSIYAYAHKNRAKLTEDDKKKTVEVPGAGVMQWYRTPAAVIFDKDLKAEDILANIKTLNLERFIRTKEEVDKEAMLKEQDVAQTIKGVSIKESEKFALRPIGTELRVEYNLGSKRWKIADKD